MSICLICAAELTLQMSWSSLFLKEKELFLCNECEEKFTFIKGETCRMCDRPFAGLDPKFISGDCCRDCVRWEEDEEWRGLLQRNHSLVTYNEFAQEVIARFKFRGDYILANAMAALIEKKLHTIPFDLIVPIPLSVERLYERGFNQSEALIGACGYDAKRLLTRIHTEKQSKKSRAERIHLPQVFQTEHPIANQKILLVDDIYTTGSTLRHAAKVLLEAGAESVSSLTFARG